MAEMNLGEVVLRCDCSSFVFSDFSIKASQFTKINAETIKSSFLTPIKLLVSTADTEEFGYS